MEISTIIQCMFCKELFVIKTEVWDSGETINCVCNNMNGKNRGRFTKPRALNF